MIVGQTNEQVDDLIDRLASRQPRPPDRPAVGRRLHPVARASPPHQNVAARSSVADLIEHPVVVATAAKWAVLKDVDRTWPWAIVDEAYQMRSDALLRVARLFDKALFVGDPGQLDPFSTVETERWLGLNWDPMSSAVAVLLTNNPDIPVHTLPVSWRLPASAAPVVSAAFYPFTGFPPRPGQATAAMRWNTRPFGLTSFDLALRDGRRDRLGAVRAAATGTRCRPTPRRSPPAPGWPPGCCSAARSRSPSGRRSRCRSPPTGSRSG